VTHNYDELKLSRGQIHRYTDSPSSLSKITNLGSKTRIRYPSIP